MRLQDRKGYYILEIDPDSRKVVPKIVYNMVAPTSIGYTPLQVYSEFDASKHLMKKDYELTLKWQYGEDWFTLTDAEYFVNDDQIAEVDEYHKVVVDGDSRIVVLKTLQELIDDGITTLSDELAKLKDENVSDMYKHISDGFLFYGDNRCEVNNTSKIDISGSYSASKQILAFQDEEKDNPIFNDSPFMAMNVIPWKFANKNYPVMLSKDHMDVFHMLYWFFIGAVRQARVEHDKVIQNFTIDDVVNGAVDGIWDISMTNIQSQIDKFVLCNCYPSPVANDNWDSEIGRYDPSFPPKTMPTIGSIDCVVDDARIITASLVDVVDADRSIVSAKMVLTNVNDMDLPISSVNLAIVGSDIGGGEFIMIPDGVYRVTATVTYNLNKGSGMETMTIISNDIPVAIQEESDIESDS